MTLCWYPLAIHGNIIGFCLCRKVKTRAGHGCTYKPTVVSNPVSGGIYYLWFDMKADFSQAQVTKIVPWPD